MKPQNQRILKYLQTHKRGITQMEAFTKLGVCRLSERIRELEGVGKRPRQDNSDNHWNIWHDPVFEKNRFGQKCFVTRYRLA